MKNSMKRSGRFFCLMSIICLMNLTGAGVSADVFEDFEVTFYHMDHLGNVLVMTDEEGEKAWPPDGADMTDIHGIKVYEPFGQTDDVTGSWNSGPVFSFTGKETDRIVSNENHVNIHDFGARHHLPETAAFMTPDPVEGDFSNPLSWNRYAFCLNNPISYVDPDGRKVKPSSQNAFNLIVQSIPLKTQGYVELSADGFIDAQLINECKNTDINFHSLKQLVNSPGVVEVHVSSTFTSANRNKSNLTTSTLSSIELGITLPGTASTNEVSQYSPDGSTHVYVNPSLSGIDGVETLAHELYGHAWSYVMGKTPYNHIDQMTSRMTPFGLEVIIGDYKQTPLEERIRKVQNAARKNYTD